MTLSEAIAKAKENQNLIGTSHKDLKIEALIPAPKKRELFNAFVNEFKFHELQLGIANVDFRAIAKATGTEALDYDVFVLYEGTLHENSIQMNGNIVWESFTNFTASPES